MEVNLTTKLSALSQISKLRFEKILQKIPGMKDITIEPNLIRPLERICGVKWLRVQGVDKIYKLESKTPVHAKETHLYLISANLIVFKRVLNQIQESLNVNSAMKYHIIVTPRILVTFEKLLEEEGLYDLVALYAFKWEFIHIDTGILSLEAPNFFKEVFVNSDFSLLPCMASGLHTLFCITGRPKITAVIGPCSMNILKQVDIITENLNVEIKEDSDFEVILMMDRSVDYVSALLTSTTYSGLISEIFKIRCGIVENNENINQTGSSNSNKRPYLFNMDSTTDPIYADIKNRHISEVSDILGNQARQLKSETEASKDMALSEIKTYVQTKLQKVTTKSRFLSSHLQACENIIEELGSKFEQLKKIENSFIENISRNTNVRTLEDTILMESDYMSMKLICLMSLTQQLTSDEYNNIKLQYLHQVGYKYLYIFNNLINCGLIQEPLKTKMSTLTLNLSLGSKKDFYSIASKLKLIPQNPEQVNVRAPTCPSYVFGGLYIPILAQLVSLLVKAQSENDIKSKIELLSGVLTSSENTKHFPLQRRKILICVVGGITYSEIAALDLIEKLVNCKIVVASNCILSGNDLIDAAKS